MRASSWGSSLVCLQDSIKSETELLDYNTRRSQAVLLHAHGIGAGQWSSLSLHPIIIVE